MAAIGSGPTEPKSSTSRLEATEKMDTRIPEEQWLDENRLRDIAITSLRSRRETIEKQSPLPGFLYTLGRMIWAFRLRGISIWFQTRGMQPEDFVQRVKNGLKGNAENALVIDAKNIRWLTPKQLEALGKEKSDTHGTLLEEVIDSTSVGRFDNLVQYADDRTLGRIVKYIPSETGSIVQKLVLQAFTEKREKTSKTLDELDAFFERLSPFSQEAEVITRTAQKVLQLPTVALSSTYATMIFSCRAGSTIPPDFFREMAKNINERGEDGAKKLTRIFQRMFSFKNKRFADGITTLELIKKPIVAAEVENLKKKIGSLDTLSDDLKAMLTSTSAFLDKLRTYIQSSESANEKALLSRFAEELENTVNFLKVTYTANVRIYNQVKSELQGRA